MPLLEAMAAARPVVATSVGNLPDVVSEGETGFLVPRQNKDALADALATLLGDEVLCARMGVAARQAVVSYDVKTMIARYEELFEEPTASAERSRHGQ